MSGNVPGPAPQQDPQHPPVKPPADDSLSNAKTFGLDLGKSSGSTLWDDIKKDKPLSACLRDAIAAGLQECAKDAVKELQKDRDPTSPHAMVLQRWSAGYFSMFGKDINDILAAKTQRDYSSVIGYDLYGMKAKEANAKLFSSTAGSAPDGATAPDGTPSKGFDWSVGAPSGGVKLKGAWTDLATKGIRPETLKEVSAGESIELKYTLDGTQIKAALKADGTFDLGKVRNWRDITYKDLETGGSAKVSGDLTLGIDPAKARDWLTRTLAPSDPLGGTGDKPSSNAPSHDPLDRVHIELGCGLSWSSTAGSGGSARIDSFEAHGKIDVTLSLEPDYGKKNAWFDSHKDR